MSTWSFRGAAFYRMEPNGQPREWPAELQTTTDVIAGDVGAVPRRYVDIGAVVHEPWSLRAGCDTAAARDALVALRYTSGTLTTIGGASYTALMRKATPITHDGSGVYEADMIFELLS
jgi:hypothetical protein